MAEIVGYEPVEVEASGSDETVGVAEIEAVGSVRAEPLESGGTAVVPEADPVEHVGVEAPGSGGTVGVAVTEVAGYAEIAVVAGLVCIAVLHEGKLVIPIEE